MKLLTKNLLAGAIVGSLALAGAVFADEEIRHKIIEIKAEQHKDIEVSIESDDGSEIVVLDRHELQDQAALEEKLVNLDEETRNTVVKALGGIHFTSKSGKGNEHEKVFVLNGGKGASFNWSGAHDSDVEVIVGDGGKRKFVHKQVLFVDDNSDEILKGHISVINKLIERGEFSPEELDSIQAALDAKR